MAKLQVRLCMVVATQYSTNAIYTIGDEVWRMKMQQAKFQCNCELAKKAAIEQIMEIGSSY